MPVTRGSEWVPEIVVNGRVAPVTELTIRVAVAEVASFHVSGYAPEGIDADSALKHAGKGDIELRFRDGRVVVFDVVRAYEPPVFGEPETIAEVGIMADGGMVGRRVEEVDTAMRAEAQHRGMSMGEMAESIRNGTVVTAAEAIREMGVQFRRFDESIARTVDRNRSDQVHVHRPENGWTAAWATESEDEEQ